MLGVQVDEEAWLVDLREAGEVVPVPAITPWSLIPNAVVADQAPVVAKTLSALRDEFGSRLQLADPDLIRRGGRSFRLEPQHLRLERERQRALLLSSG